MKFIIFLLAYLSSIICFSGTLIKDNTQFKGTVLIGITTFGSYADASSSLEINSTTTGLLLPRMNTTQMEAISSPAEGLMIFNTQTSTVRIYANSTWATVSTE